MSFTDADRQIRALLRRDTVQPSNEYELRRISDQLKPWGSAGIPPQALSVVVRAYETRAHPRHLLGRVNKTVVSLRSLELDRTQSYLEGILDYDQRKALVEFDGDFDNTDASWTNHVPAHLKPIWPKLPPEAKIVTVVMAFAAKERA